MQTRSRKILLLAMVLTAKSALASEFIPGEVIVKYKEGIVRTRSQANSLYQALHIQHVHRFQGLMRGFEHLTLDSGANIRNVIADLRRDASIEYAQPNYILHTLPIHEQTPYVEAGNVHMEYACWFEKISFPPFCKHLPPLGMRPAPMPAPEDVVPPIEDPKLTKTYGMNSIGAVEAWKQFRGSKDIIVADIDTGADYNHEDLAFNMWHNPNPTKNDDVGFDFVHNDGLPFDDNSHGTHTAGTIGAVGGNGKGVSGVAQRVSIMAVKFLSGQGSGTSADAIKAIDYAIDHGAKILSNSWGGQADPDNNALKEAVERARARDVLFIAAAGNEGANNDGSTPSFPAAFDSDNMIAVAATDKSDRLASFSNYGLKSVHLAAPGVDIYSTIPGNEYKAESGTSMACPHVAGAAAMVWAAHPAWNYKQVKAALLSSVDKLPSLEGKTITGGRLNVLKALSAME